MTDYTGFIEVRNELVKEHPLFEIKFLTHGLIIIWNVVIWPYLVIRQFLGNIKTFIKQKDDNS